jgi:hypothetical protein
VTYEWLQALVSAEVPGEERPDVSWRMVCVQLHPNDRLSPTTRPSAPDLAGIMRHRPSSDAGLWTPQHPDRILKVGRIRIRTAE